MIRIFDQMKYNLPSHHCVMVVYECYPYPRIEQETFPKEQLMVEAASRHSIVR